MHLRQAPAKWGFEDGREAQPKSSPDGVAICLSQACRQRWSAEERRKEQKENGSDSTLGSALTELDLLLGLESVSSG
jgi:hypothetical protein